MAEEALSEHCSLMERPGGPPKPAERPADCPKDAAYVKGTGGMIFPNDAPFPFVIEGGNGDDKVVIVGRAPGGLMVHGGKGDDSVTIVDGDSGRGTVERAHARLVGGKSDGGVLVQDRSTWITGEIGPASVVTLVAITLSAVAAICWRALGPAR